LFKNQKEKDRCGDEGAFPQTFRFLDKSRQPFKAVLHKPGVFVAPDIAGIEIENSTDSPYEFYVQFIFVPVNPPKKTIWTAKTPRTRRVIWEGYGDLQIIRNFTA